MRMMNKVVYALLSLAIAFGLWLYVITVNNPNFRDTIYNIPVVLTGESVLQERGLIVTERPSVSVDLTLSGNRTDVVKCDRSNITLKVDVSKIYDPGVHYLEYTIAYPGNVPNNAFSVEGKSPAMVPVTIDKWERKEIPVNVLCEGTVSEGFFADTENVTRDHAYVVVQGPSTVVQQIHEAKIIVDMDDQKESISRDYRYTLTDAAGEPVDAAQIEVNVEEIHVDLKIQTVKDVNLVINLVPGGGATADTVLLEYGPKTIKMAGSESVLADLNEIVLGTINLAEFLEPTEFTYEIPELEGVTNLSGITEITARLSFPMLAIREFDIEAFRMVNVPENMKAELITAKLHIKVRGMAAEIYRLTEDDIIATVDFSGTQVGTTTFKVAITFAKDFQNVGAVGANTVTAQVTQGEEQ